MARGKRGKHWRRKSASYLVWDRRYERKGPWECYILDTGKFYHPFWCDAVHHAYLEGRMPARVATLKQANLEGYGMCYNCDTIHQKVGRR